MNQKVWSLLLIAVLTLSLSCNKSNVIEADAGYEYPVAAFSYTGNDGPSPVNIQFTNYSETIIEDYCTYTWTFGENGATSDEKNPLHTFYNNSASTITVLVSLEVLDLESKLSQTRSIPIEILPAQ